MKRLVRLIATFLLLLTAACSTIEETATDAVLGITDYLGGEDNLDPPKELLPLEAEIVVSALWKVDTGGDSGKQRVTLVPALFSDKIVTADRKGVVGAYRLGDGEQIWKVDTKLLLSGGPGVGNGTVIIGTSDGEVIALDEVDGREIWRVSVSSEVLAVPQVAQDVVVIRTNDGRIAALSEKDGHLLWYYDRSVPALSLRGTGSPIIMNDAVIDGYASGRLVALRLSDGLVGWERSIAIPSGRTELDRIVDIDSDPVIVDDVIYIASFQGGVAAMSLSSGDLIWNRREISSFAGLVAGWQYLFVTDEHSDIWALDLQNGASLWRQNELHNRQLTAPVVFGDYIVAGDFEGYLHWFSQEDGRQVARLKIDDKGIVAAPIVDAEVLYVYGKGGMLAAVAVQ